MALDPLSSYGGKDVYYFGPLAGYSTQELDERGLDQDKKDTRGFVWTSEKNRDVYSGISMPNTKDFQYFGFTPRHYMGNKNQEQVNENKILKGRSQSYKDYGENWDEVKVNVPMWMEFTQRTTFHGIRYIFDPSPYRMRK